MGLPRSSQPGRPDPHLRRHRADEYHGPVDDNAYTNGLARWNLRQAAALDGLDEKERANWLAIAEGLVDGFDRISGIYEQFSGFFELSRSSSKR